MVLDHGANLTPGANPAPLREGVASTRVSLFGADNLDRFGGSMSRQLKPKQYIRNLASA
jgi:hypothetical protein